MTTDFANKKWLRSSDRTRNIILAVIAAIVIVAGTTVAAKGAMAPPQKDVDALAMFHGYSDSRELETLVFKICIEDVAEQNGAPDAERFARA